VNPCHSEVHSIQTRSQFSFLLEVNPEQGVSPAVLSVWNNFEGKKVHVVLCAVVLFCCQSIMLQFCTSELAITGVQACLSFDDSAFNNTPIRQLSHSYLLDNCGAVGSGWW
jgi:hypothetical protein